MGDSIIKFVFLLALLASFIVNCNDFYTQRKNPFLNRSYKDIREIPYENNDIEQLKEKLKAESIYQINKKLVFKVQQHENILQTDPSSPDFYKINGIIKYYDYDGNLKPGKNISVFVYKDQKPISNTLTDDDGKWEIELNHKSFYKSKINIRFSMSNNYLEIKRLDYYYEWEILNIDSFEKDIYTGIITPDKTSENSKVGYIFEIFNRYLTFFKNEKIEINSWWKYKIIVFWPHKYTWFGYENGNIGISEAKRWDVIGHEIGHAVAYTGIHSPMSALSNHKVSQCYSEQLAWAEGIATFLSGVVNLKRNEPDTRFQYLFPRYLENVPDDVCPGQTNEWRVAAFMWDLYDLNNEGNDTVNLSFKKIWEPLITHNKTINSLDDALKIIKDNNSELKEKELQSLMEYNKIYKK